MNPEEIVKIAGETKEDNKISNVMNQKNRWAIVGLACALGGVNIIGLLASLLGIKNAKKQNGEYMSFAVAGAIICIVHIFRILIATFHSFITPAIEGAVTFPAALWNFIITIITTL